MQRIHIRPLRRWSDSVDVSVEGFDADLGMPARGLFRQRAEQEWERAARKRKPVAVLLFAIDRHREYGSAAFKACQRVVGNTIAGHCRRRADLVGRLRDHEFAVLLSGSSRQGAREVAANICQSVEQQQHNPTGKGGVLTLSAGVSAMVPRPTRTLESLLIAADAGLREARQRGGNTVRISSKLR